MMRPRSYGNVNYGLRRRQVTKLSSRAAGLLRRPAGRRAGEEGRAERERGSSNDRSRQVRSGFALARSTRRGRQQRADGPPPPRPRCRSTSRERPSELLVDVFRARVFLHDTIRRAPPPPPPFAFVRRRRGRRRRDDEETNSGVHLP